jgi:hypothetical protein
VPTQLFSPVLSPDDETAAYLARQESGRYALVLRDLASGRERRVELEADQAGAIVWSPDGRSLLLTLASHPCQPPDWTQSIVQVDATSLALKTLISNDKRLFAVTAWLEAGRVELRDKDGKFWWLDVASGTVTEKQ